MERAAWLAVKSSFKDLSLKQKFAWSFVATVLHPVFFTSRAKRQIEISDYETGTVRPPVDRAKVIRQYLHIPPYKGVATYGQPAEQVCIFDFSSFIVGLKVGYQLLTQPSPHYKKESVAVMYVPIYYFYSQVWPIFSE